MNKEQKSISGLIIGIALLIVAAYQMVKRPFLAYVLIVLGTTLTIISGTALAAINAAKSEIRNTISGN